MLWDCAKEIESLLSEFETIESWAFILCRLILFESRLLEINLVKRLSAVKVIYLEDGCVKPDLIVIVELSNYFYLLGLFCGGGEMHVNLFYPH
jgi:hypothetical protein